MEPISLNVASAILILTSSLTLIPQLIHLYATRMRMEDNLNSKISFGNNAAIYDFIIVGAGAGGSMVANRLSKSGKYKILLLDKGGDPNPFTSIPFFYGETAKSPDTVHIYQSIPQKGAYLSNGGIVDVPQGIGLGGSTEVNDMQYLRGSPSIYDEWAYLTGDTDWSFSNVLPLFKKFENYEGKWRGSANNSIYRGFTGEIHVEEQTFDPTRSYLFSALREKGYREADLNAGGPKDKEFDLIQMDTKQGRRQGAYESLLNPIIKRRKNLTILRYSTVTKIHFDCDNRAIGVTYDRHGKWYYAHASKEIVVSAGAIGSPKLLMLSGVGPKRELERIGIPCKVDLPVGRRFLDHTGVTLIALFNESISFLPERDLKLSAVPEYFEHGKGPLRSAEGFFTMIYRKAVNDRRPAPALQIIVGCGNVNPVTSSYESQAHIAQSYAGKDRNVILIYNYQPKSVGELYLANNSQSTDPILNQKFYSHPDDIEVVLDGIKYMVDLYETSNSYKRFNTTIVPESTIQRCENLEFRSDEYWKCYIRESTNYGIHPSGANTMGKGINDFKAVVDSKLRVLSTHGLRVIDSSIIPKIPNVNLMVPTLMIGENGAKFMQTYWNF